MNKVTSLNHLSPEEMFMVLCCRQFVFTDAANAIQDLVSKDLDWLFIEDITRGHAIEGPVYLALSQCCKTGHVPQGLLMRLKLATRHNAFKNLLFSSAFKDILKHCTREQIRIIPLKGIAFLNSIYTRRNALRSLADIDILVEKHNLSHFEKILMRMGYKKKNVSAHSSHRHFHSIFWRSVSGLQINVEAHWDVDFTDSPYAIDIAGWWERSHAKEHNGAAYYEFSLEDNLIFNCFHILRGIQKVPTALLPLKNFCDIAIMINQSGIKIDWKCLLSRALEYNVLRPVALVLLLVRDLLDITAIPSDIIDILHGEGYQDSFGACAVKEYIFVPWNPGRHLLPFWAEDLALQTTLRGKIKILLRLPNIIAAHYKAKYYRSKNPSIIRTLRSTGWYYAKKTARTLIFFVFSSREAQQHQKKMIRRNIKSGTMINWLRQSSNN